MVLVSLQWLKGHQFFDDNGDPLNGGDLFIQDAGTTSLRTTYSDDDGTVANTLNGSNRIVLAADGRLDESVYIPTGLWKYTLRDSSAQTIATEDNILGAIDTSVFLTSAATAETPVISKTSDYTIVDGDQTKIINANPTGASFTLTLPSAVTVGDGWFVTVKHVGSANTVTITGVSAQTIDGSSSRILSAQYEQVTIVSDGANWHVTTYSHPSLDHGKFLGRTTTGDGPQEQIIVPFGQCQLTKSGSSLLLSPYDGNLLTINSAAEVVPSAGVSLSVSGLSNSTLYYIYAYMSSGTMTLEASATAYATQSTTGIRTKSGDDTRTLVGMAYLSGGAFIDSATQRYVRSYYNEPGLALLNSFSTNRTSTSTSYAEINSEIRVEFLSWSGEVVDLGINGACGNDTNGGLTFTAIGIDDATAEDSYSLNSTHSSGTTHPIAVRLLTSSLTEGYHYATLVGKVGANTGTWIGSSTVALRTTLRALLGGSTGARGPEGFAGLDYTFASSTSMADPGAGLIRLNNASFASVTAIAIDDTSAASGNPDVSAEILSWNDSSSTIDGTLRIFKPGGRENFAIYQVTGLTDNSGWTQIAVTYVIGNGSFTAGDALAVQFTRTGDKGDAGATGPTGSTSFNFDSTTSDADPGSGDLRLNNATAASATEAYIDNNNRGGSDVSAWLDTFDDGGSSANRGALTIADAAAPTTIFRIYSVTGSVTDGTGYRKVTISHVAGAGSFTNGNELIVSFFRTGPSGTVGGTMAATDNLIVRSDGTGGTTIQSGVNIIGDSGDITFPEQSAPSTPASGKVALYAKTDGRFYELDDAGAERGLSPVGKQTIWLPAAAMWARTTNGPASVSRELTTGGDIMVKGWAFDTTTEEGVQFYIGPPKSWNKSTISFQPVWTNASGLTTETVSWGLSVGAYTDSDPLDTTDFGTEVRVSDTWLAQNDIHVADESAAVTVGNTPINGDVLIGQIVRSVANDNMTGDAELLGAWIYITTNAATDV